MFQISLLYSCLRSLYFYEKLNVHQHVHKIPPLDDVWSHFSSICIISVLILPICLRIGLPSCLCSPDFSTKMLYEYLYHVRPTCPVHLSLFYLSTSTVLGESTNMDVCNHRPLERWDSLLLPLGAVFLWHTFMLYLLPCVSRSLEMWCQLPIQWVLRYIWSIHKFILSSESERVADKNCKLRSSSYTFLLLYTFSLH
jgi:hypothetical protein